MGTELAEVFPAGEHLSDELEARGWSQADFAEILGRPPQFVSEIISGKKEITRESAAQIGAALGTSAELWLRLQDEYLLWRQSQDGTSRETVEEVRTRARLAEIAPLRELRRRGVITSNSTAGLVDEVKILFGLDSIWDEPHLMIAARRGNRTDPLTATQNGWLACVVRGLAGRSTASYSPSHLRSLAAQLSRTVRDPAAVADLPKLYAEAGVRLVHVPAFPSSKLSGAAFRDDAGPVIALSGLRPRLDITLFTLLHETAHIALGHLDDHGGISIEDEEHPHTLGDEHEADNLAEQWLLPHPLPPVPTRVTRIWVDKTASMEGVHPIVIVGRLQHLRLVPWNSALATGAPKVTQYLQQWSTDKRPPAPQPHTPRP